jgi:hypothetical protein
MQYCSFPSRSSRRTGLADFVPQFLYSHPGSIPAGTEFLATYKGKTYLARAENGALVLNGRRLDSPSAAAMSITGKPVNGWTFWEGRLPGRTAWQIIKAQRSSVVKPVAVTLFGFELWPAFSMIATVTTVTMVTSVALEGRIGMRRNMGSSCCRICLRI